MSNRKGLLNKRGLKLVGRRLDPQSPAGAEIAKLREYFGIAAQGITLLEGVDPHSDEGIRLRTNASLRVPITKAAIGQAESRERAVRKQVLDAIRGVEQEAGRPPDSIGVPRAMIEETRAALRTTPYANVKVVEAKA
jgi:hypothetical protein